jgi:hypothetical protein
VLSLCQRAGASCGACCGLYNREDLSRAAVREDLAQNTELLSRTSRTREAVHAAAAQRAQALPDPLFPSVRICPLLGYLDASGSRIGCLAHPRVTGGPDLRACGVYDELTCDAFLCPSHAHLSEDEATLAARASGDFYLYGLVVTDAAFLHAVLDGLEALAGFRPVPGDLDHPPFRSALAALLALKEELAPGSEGLFAAFRPSRDKQTMPTEEPQGGSPAERVQAALGGDLRSGNDGDALEGEVRRRLYAAASALAGAIPGREGGATAARR